MIGAMAGLWLGDVFSFLGFGLGLSLFAGDLDLALVFSLPVIQERVSTPTGESISKFHMLSHEVIITDASGRQKDSISAHHLNRMSPMERLVSLPPCWMLGMSRSNK